MADGVCVVDTYVGADGIADVDTDVVADGIPDIDPVAPNDFLSDCARDTRFEHVADKFEVVCKAVAETWDRCGAVCLSFATSCLGVKIKTHEPASSLISITVCGRTQIAVPGSTLRMKEKCRSFGFIRSLVLMWYAWPAIICLCCSRVNHANEHSPVTITSTN